MGSYVVGFDEADEARIGGKGAGLAALARIEGVRVPPGFCVTTDAFRRGGSEVPEDVAREVRRALAGDAAGTAYAVRSSATGEDSLTASFAGQHESFLDVVGPEVVLEHIARVWASVSTEHAVAYRQQRGADRVAMAVVVQRMVAADAAGVLFTADPVSGNRRVATVEATPGLADALVSGRVDPDVYRVRDGEIIERRSVTGALTDAQVVELVALGWRVEAELGTPQDVEWCLDAEGFALVQSRPITTLFPVPAGSGFRVYMSVGHQQMMTDPMRPLGISFFRLAAMAPMHEAGCRLWVDAAPVLKSPGRGRFLEMIAKSDPLTGDALRTLIERGDVGSGDGAGPAAATPPLIDADPTLVAELVARAREDVDTLKLSLAGKSGPELLAVVLADFGSHKQAVFNPSVMPPITAAMEATWWLSERLEEWLGERGAADVLSQSVPGNISSEMGLALLDVADVVRKHSEVVAFLEGADDAFLEALPTLPGGREARDAITGYLDRYGMRCIGEIDITRPRWIERPSTLLPMLLANVRGFATGEGRRRFEEGSRAAAQAERDVLARVAMLPGGASKVVETRAMIARLRTFAGYREHPKYHIVSRFLVYKQALMWEARRLAEAGVIDDAEDVFWLTIAEFAEAVQERVVDPEVLRRRRADFAASEALAPPRVLTSDGEALLGSYAREDVPAGALVGLAVSAGTIEGRARVVRDLDDADLQHGEILVTRFTDPSWSPLFVAAAGLVTEVGGMMTHGAVVAREYGLPAVVGVERATRLIENGRRIRVHGSDGFVERLD